MIIEEILTNKPTEIKVQSFTTEYPFSLLFIHTAYNICPSLSFAPSLSSLPSICGIPRSDR